MILPPSHIFATGEGRHTELNASWNLGSIPPADARLPANLSVILSEQGNSCSSIQALPGLQPFQILLYMVSNNLSTYAHMETLMEWIHSTRSFETLKVIAQIQTPSAKAFSAHLFTHAINAGDPYVTRAFLAGGLSQGSYRQGSCFKPTTACFRSIKYGQWDMAKLLLSAGGYTRGREDLEYEAFLHISNVLKVDLNLTVEGKPTHVPAVIDVLEALINTGATFKPSEIETWQSIHSAACILGWLDLVAVLNRIEAIGQLNRKLDHELHHAVKFMDFGQVRALYGQGANVESWEPSRCLPIVLAVSSQNCEMVRVLLELGANPNNFMRPNGGKINFPQSHLEYFGPLHLAATLKHTGLVAILLEGGADVSAIDGYGRTALHYLEKDLIRRSSSALLVAKQLLDHGADVNVRSRDGSRQTVIEMMLGNVDSSWDTSWNVAAKLLLDYGVQLPWFDATSNGNMGAIQGFPRHRRNNGYITAIRFCQQHYQHFIRHEQLPFTTWLNGLFEAALSSSHFMAIHDLLKAGADAGKMKGLPYKEVTSMIGFDDVVTVRDIMWKAVAQGADINAFSEQHTIPFLTMAIMREDFAMVTFLLSKGANVTQYPRSGMFSPLHLLVGRSSDVFIHETAKAIIARGANIGAYEFVTTDGQFLELESEVGKENFGYMCMHACGSGIPTFEATPVQAACLYKNMTAVQLLCEEGADINALASGRRGFTALQLAIYQRDKDMVQYLLNRSADVHAPSASEIGLTALQCAILAKDADSTETLRSLGADAGAPAAAKIGCTALQAAVMKDNVPLARALLISGVDVNAAGGSEYGRTALQAACYKNNLELAETFLQHNADIDAPPCKMKGATALQCAAMHGNLDLVVMLLGYGANVDAPGAEVDGRTALQAAAENGRLDIVNLLLQVYPDPLSRKEEYGRAAELARKEGHEEVAKMLQDWKLPAASFSHFEDTLRPEDLQPPLIMDEIDILW